MLGPMSFQHPEPLLCTYYPLDISFVPLNAGFHAYPCLCELPSAELRMAAIVELSLADTGYQHG